MKIKHLLLVSFVILIIGLTAVSATDSDNTATTDNSGSDVAVDSSSSTSQATDSSTHTDSSVDKTSDTSSSSSQKTDTTSQSTTQKVSEKTSENTQTTSDTTAKTTSSDTTDKVSSDTVAKTTSDTASQSTQSSSQSTQQVQSSTNTTNENTNTVKENVVDTTKTISTADDDTVSEAATVYTIRDLGSFYMAYRESSPGDIFDFEGNFSSFSFEFEKQLSLTSYGNAKFTNVMFIFTSDASNSVIRNLNFNNSGTGEPAINIVSANNIIIQNNSIILDGSNSNGNGIIIHNANNITIKDNNITFSNLNANNSYALGVYSSSNVNITNNNIRVNNSNVLGKGVILNGTNSSYVEYNNISVSALSDDIDWSTDEGVPNTYSLGIFGSSNIFARYNNIECYGNSSSYTSTVVAVSVQGSNMNSQKATYDYIMYNNITVQDKKYAYGVYLQYNVDSCYVDYNNITSINKEGSYAAGVNEYSTNNLNIMGNNITLDVEDTAYGIVLTGDSEAYSSNKAIMSNTINATSNRTRGIELYYVNHTLVQSNSIIVNGNYTEGICGGSTLYTNITKNRIMVNGVYTNSTKDIDEILLVNTGIYLSQAAYENKTNIHSSYINNITGNYIYSYGNSTIFLSSSYNDVENNQLTLNRGSYILYGDETVYNNGTNNTIENNTGYILSGSQLDDQTLAVTHVITQDNYQDYFIQKTDSSDGGLSDSVNDGDILDFQGTLNLTNNQSLIINKAVNITSTTGDALICLNTEAGTLLGEDQGSCFVVNNGGAYSNITNIKFFNTQIWITNTSYVVLDNISAIVNGSRVGSGVGQTSIRPGCEYITIKNSYFYTENNGGSSTLVIAGGKYCTIDNNTVDGEGTSGNLIYLTTYNADLDGIDDFNSYNNITNNHVICNSDPESIRWGIVLTGHDNNVINNTIDYPSGGLGITQQWNYNGTFNTTIINNTCVNCGQSNLPENSTVYGNTFSEVQISAGSTFYNNTVNSIMITGDECIITNNTILSNLTLNTTNNLIENNTFNGENISINLTAGNNTLENNVIEGNAQINITGSNNTLKNQEVSGSALFNVNGDSNIIANNSATKTEIANSYLTINGSDNIVENNTIYRVTNDLAIIPDSTISISANSNNNIVRYNDIICYDYLRGTSLVGDDCVYVTDGTTGNVVQDNYGTIPEIVIPTPEEGTNYTYITYNVTSMAELISALDDIKANGTYSNDTKYVINLLDGDYTVTEAITWDGATSDVREVIINGTCQTINGNGFSSTFLTIGQGYSLILNNVTITNFPLESSIHTISDSGNLTILNSFLDNAGYIYAQSSTLIINNTNITQTAISAMSGTCNITYSTIYNTDLSSIGMDLIDTFGGNFIFLHNNVTNITSTYLIYGMGGSSSSLVFIEDNIFTDINTTSDSIYIMLNGVEDIAGTLINNTFINGIRITLSPDTTKFYKMNNNYINCSIPVNITNIPNSNITTEDYTTTITVSADSSYGATIDGQVTIFIDGKEYKTFDVVNGKTNITIENSALNLAGNEIEVKYVSPNNGFENASTTFTITLAEDMIIRIPEGTLYSGDTIALTTQVAVNGSIAKDGYVIFKVNGKTVRDENGNPIMVQVDENGMASLNYTIPDTYSNEYNITAVYSGSEGIVRTNTTLTTSLKTATITVDQITAKAGQTVTLRAYITDQNGKTVTTGKLIFKLNGKTLKDANGNTLYATINNGVATLNYTIPDNYSAKDYILTAVYQGTGFERSEANSTLTLTKSTPTIIPDSTVFGTNNTITINQGQESVNIKATIIDPETNAPIDTTTVVTIKINDKTVTQQYVSNGQIDMTIYTSSFNNPEYNITVVVGENSQYARTSFNGTLIVNPMNTLANEISYNGTLLVKED